jgi:hypothetical protein
MINVRVEVRNETRSFTVAVRSENLRQATQIARGLYPGSAVRVVFPIEPNGFFVVGPHHNGHVDLGGAGEAGAAGGAIDAGLARR